MKVTSRGLLRTTLLTSSAGLMLGVPLLSTIPARLRGGETKQDQAVIRGQSQDDGGALTRLFGSRTDAQSPNVATDLDPAAAADSPPPEGSMWGRMFGRDEPTQATMSRQALRAQARFLRRNPYAARLMMLQQQALLLQQQQSLQEEYEQEAMPDPEVFDSLQIDPGEWADAPGREITEQLPAGSASKPWWQTGEKPVNARERRSLDDSEDAADEPANPSGETLEPAPAAEPNLAPSVGGGTPAAPAAQPAPVIPTPEATPEPGTSVGIAPPEPAAPIEEWSLTFPDDSKPKAQKPAAVNQPAEPAAEIPSGPAPFVPPEPAAASNPEPTDAFIPEPPAPARELDNTSPETLTVPESSLTPAAPKWRTAAAPESAAPMPEASSSPEASSGGEAEGTSESTAPEAPAFPSSADPFASPTPAGEIPAEPMSAPEATASSPADPFADPPAAESVTEPQPAAPLASEPAETQSETTQPEATAPAGAPTQAAPPSDETTQEPAAESPFTGLKLDEPKLTPLPAAPAPESLSDDSSTGQAPPNPFAAPAEETTSPPAPAPQTPGVTDPDPQYQFPPQRTVAVPNPAPFIPPAPEQFGDPVGTPGEYYVPPAAPAATESVASESPLAPDVPAWTPDQAPDPIVAPSTARKLVAAPPPSPRNTSAKLERLATRKGLSGFKGFCPVVLKNHRDLVDARPEYSAVYNGRRYFFSSAAAQVLFEETPEEYAPAALGNDVVHLMLTGESRPGSLDHAVWFRSRLYLFGSAETMETFVAAPSIHAWEE